MFEYSMINRIGWIVMGIAALMAVAVGNWQIAAILAGIVVLIWFHLWQWNRCLMPIRNYVKAAQDIEARRL